MRQSVFFHKSEKLLVSLSLAVVFVLQKQSNANELAVQIRLGFGGVKRPRDLIKFMSEGGLIRAARDSADRARCRNQCVNRLLKGLACLALFDRRKAICGFS